MQLQRKQPSSSLPAGPEYYRPELMAIGDSLFNGVQSLRINWFLSEWSPPALVAIRLGLIEEHAGDRNGLRSFYGPQYPDQGLSPDRTLQYGFSLESIPADLGILQVPKAQAREFTELLAFRPPDGRIFVDNIAFSGAQSQDMLFIRAADHRQAALRSIAAVKGDHGITQGFGDLADMFTHANAAFVLDPMDDDCVGQLAPIEQVELRHPRRLMVNIGANDGMYSLAFMTKSVDQAAPCTRQEAGITGIGGQPECVVATIRTSMATAYLGDMQKLIDRLSHVQGLENVYIDGLVTPSRTANPIPGRSRGTLQWKNDLWCGSSPCSTRESAEDMQAANDFIRNINLEIKGLVDKANLAGSGPTFTFVDVEDTISRFDAKSCAAAASVDPGCVAGHQFVSDQKRFGGIGTAYFDNRPIRLDGETGVRTRVGSPSKVIQGGLFGFDNMHLSPVGYELLAATVIKAMQSNRDGAVLPALNKDRSDPCKSKGQPGFKTMRIGDCAALLTTPGWSYNDATRRRYMTLRTAGMAQTADLDLLKARISFLKAFVH